MMRLLNIFKRKPITYNDKHLTDEELKHIFHGIKQHKLFIDLLKKNVAYLIDSIDNSLLMEEALKAQNYAYETAFKLGKKKAFLYVIHLLTEQEKEKKRDE